MVLYFSASVGDAQFARYILARLENRYRRRSAIITILALEFFLARRGVARRLEMLLRLEQQHLVEELQRPLLLIQQQTLHRDLLPVLHHAL